MHFFAALSYTLAAFISVSSAASIHRREAWSAADLSLRDDTPTPLIYDGGFEEKPGSSTEDWKFPNEKCGARGTDNGSGIPAHSGTHYGYIHTSEETFRYCNFTHPLSLEKGVKYELTFYEYIDNRGPVKDDDCAVAVSIGGEEFARDVEPTGGSEYKQRSIEFTWGESDSHLDSGAELVFEMACNLESYWLIDDVSLTAISNPKN
ncbi:hypothetical protein DL96DRAFT_1558326 [Flagelloscypha sp. PMI_526]|nr:hypothetical protein DL96DRAFT_1558326 [Flagelloscypha sp. PMI_526]